MIQRMWVLLYQATKNTCTSTLMKDFKNSRINERFQKFKNNFCSPFNFKPVALLILESSERKRMDD